MFIEGVQSITEYIGNSRAVSAGMDAGGDKPDEENPKCTRM
jgi:hypothetical protein